MIIRNHPITAWKASKPIAQGNALGDKWRIPRPARAKALTGSNAFALAGRKLPARYTQGVALGYVLFGLSGRLSGTCG